MGLFGMAVRFTWRKRRQPRLAPPSPGGFIGGICLRDGHRESAGDGRSNEAKQGLPTKPTLGAADLLLQSSGYGGIIKGLFPRRQLGLYFR